MAGFFFVKNIKEKFVSAAETTPCSASRHCRLFVVKKTAFKKLDFLKNAGQQNIYDHEENEENKVSFSQVLFACMKKEYGEKLDE